MVADDVPSDPSVLNTTVLSNFTYVDQVQLLAGFAGICTVPVVREELRDGVDDHPFPRSALDSLDDEIPVGSISEPVANRAAVVGEHLDPGEAQAFALANARDMMRAEAHGFSRGRTSTGFPTSVALSSIRP